MLPLLAATAARRAEPDPDLLEVVGPVPGRRRSSAPRGRRGWWWLGVRRPPRSQGRPVRVRVLR